MSSGSLSTKEFVVLTTMDQVGVWRKRRHFGSGAAQLSRTSSATSQWSAMVTPKQFPTCTSWIPYPGVKVQKHECVNHVGKRLSTALRNLVAEKSKAKPKITLGGKGHGKLRPDVIATLQRYYTKAIRSNAPVPAMKEAVTAILAHCSSTDDDHCHDHCPQGRRILVFLAKGQSDGPTTRQPWREPEHSSVQFGCRQCSPHLRPNVYRWTLRTLHPVIYPECKWECPCINLWIATVSVLPFLLVLQSLSLERLHHVDSSTPSVCLSAKKPGVVARSATIVGLWKRRQLWRKKQKSIAKSRQRPGRERNRGSSTPMGSFICLGGGGGGD